MNLALIGAAIGAIIGIIGGIIGSYCSIKNARTPTEKAFILKWVYIGWGVMTAFFLGFWLIPIPYNSFLWVLYGILFPFSLRYLNQEYQKIKKQETSYKKEKRSNK